MDILTSQEEVINYNIMIVFLYGAWLAFACKRLQPRVVQKQGRVVVLI